MVCISNIAKSNLLKWNVSVKYIKRALLILKMAAFLLIENKLAQLFINAYRAFIIFTTFDNLFRNFVTSDITAI